MSTSTLFPQPTTTFRERAASLPAHDAHVLNSANAAPSRVPADTDVLAVGGGIHALIYAIHTKLRAPGTRIAVVERGASPGYKIGESTLTTFGYWLKTVGLGPEVLGRLFGVKDGLAFFWLTPADDPRSAAAGWEDYTGFSANGPRGDFVPTCQMERKISELLLTMFAQRLGVNVYHGHAADIDGSVLSDEGNTVPVKDAYANVQTVNSKLVVDATGRFRRFSSKESRIKRFEGWNTNAYWAYFKENADESTIDLRHYETSNTNHICLPEGWAWIIRLPSWEGSPIPNLMDMISYLLDLNERGTPGDQYPSAQELARMFSLTYTWVVSIGFALRTDVVYPADLSAFGAREPEQRFNWIVSRYPKMQALMRKHTLLEDLYGPGTTWFVRRQLAYQSPVASGPGWMAVGDAAGFTNPLYSPGINCNMGTSVLAAEATRGWLAARSPAARDAVRAPYDAYCAAHTPALHRMNAFNYACMRDPRLGPLGPLWQYLCGTGNADWQSMRRFTLADVHELVAGWAWGAKRPEYVAFVESVLPLLAGAPHERVLEATVQKVLAMSDAARRRALASGVYRHRWAGLLRYYDDALERCEDKHGKDVLARRCTHCGNWWLTRADWRACGVCGGARSEEHSRIVLVDEMDGAERVGASQPVKPPAQRVQVTVTVNVAEATPVPAPAAKAAWDSWSGWWRSLDRAAAS